MSVVSGLRAFGLIILSLQFAGCGSVLDALPGAGAEKSGTSGTNNLAPPVPIGTVSGVAKDALVQAGTVNVYAWNGTKGELLGTGTTDDRGRYSLQLQVRSQPLLLEVTGGRYREEATGREVNLDSNEAFFALQNYSRGQTFNVAITYYTTLAAGLAENLVRLGMKPPDAVVEANRRLNEILGIDTITVMPTDITTPDTVGGASIQYSFATAALSSLTERASIMNGSEPHSFFTSIKFMQAAYDDVRADGVLNGRGLDGEVTFGRIRLNADIYRHELALHILRVANNKTANRAGLGPIELFGLAQRLNRSTDPIFGGAPVIPIDRDKPIVSPLVAAEFPNLVNDSVVFAGINLSAMVMAFPGAARSELVLDGDRVIGTATDPENPTVFLDTFRFPIAEGPHTLKLRVTDISQAVGESPLLRVNVSNKQTAIENVTIKDAFVGNNVMVDATITDPARVDSVQYSVRAGTGAFVPIAAPTVRENGNVFHASGMFNPRPAQGMMFPDGDATFRVEATNSAGFTFLTDVPFTIDLVPPTVSIQNPIALDTSNLNDLQGRYFDRIGGVPCMPLQPANPDDRCVLYARRNFDVSTEISDNHAINSVAFTVDGVPVGQPVTPPGITTNLAARFTVDPRTFTPPGGSDSPGEPKSLVVVAADKAQNMMMDRRQVVFDTTMPTASPIIVNAQADGGSLPAAGGRPQQVSGTLDISGMVSDEGGVAAANLTLTRPTGVVDQLASAVNGLESLSVVRENLSTRQPLLADGRYTITLNGSDRAGNALIPIRRDLDVDNTGPTIVTTGEQEMRGTGCRIFGRVSDGNLATGLILQQVTTLSTILRGGRELPGRPYTDARNGTADEPVMVNVRDDGTFTATFFTVSTGNGSNTVNYVMATLRVIDALGNSGELRFDFTSSILRDNRSDDDCSFGFRPS